jgi:A/G-specific adenine glycosylase
MGSIRSAAWVTAFRRELIEFGRKYQGTFEWAVERTAYRILVAEVLLTRTGAPRVAEVFPRFVARYPDLESLAGAEVEEVRRIVRPLGITGRGDRLRDMARLFVEEYGGTVPEDRGSLLSVHGIGLYCANAILCFGHGKPAPLVDVNVERILARALGLGRGERTAGKMWELAEWALPKEDAADYNYGLLHLGIRICTHADPACLECPLIRICSQAIAQERRSILRFFKRAEPG